MKQISDFKLVGLSKPCSMTCEPLDNEEIFWVKPNMSKENFHALWDYMKNHWDEPVFVELEHEGIKIDGIPHNPTFIKLKTQQ